MLMVKDRDCDIKKASLVKAELFDGVLGIDDLRL
jgi:hypothetical protein